MDRRDFLALSAGAFAASALAQEAPGVKPAPLKKAVNLGMVEGKGSVLEKLKMIQDAGFDGVELNRPDAIGLDEMKSALAETKMPVANVICSTHWAQPITANDPVLREKGQRGFQLALEETGELGCDRMLLVPGVVKADVSYADAWTRSQAGIRAALPVAEKAKVKIAIENVWNHFLLSPLEAARFVDDFASPWVGWHFDIGNIVSEGWPAQWIRILGGRILTLHFKDYSRKKRDAEGPYKGFNVELGDGDANWPETMKALREVGFGGWAVLEVSGGDAARLKFLAERTDKLIAS